MEKNPVIEKALQNGEENRVLFMRRGLLMARAIQHPLRQEVIQNIIDYAETDISPTVQDLYQKHRYTTIQGKRYIEQSLMSQQLGILRRSGIIEFTKKGKNVLYSVNITQLRRAEQLLLTMGRLAPTEIDVDDSRLKDK
jgi:DNA-binding transcriptional ArsR family regulator